MNTVSGLGGLIVTVETGTGFTVSVALPDWPSLVAVIVVVPVVARFATPVATPDEFTVAAAVFVELHAIVRPGSTFPCASFVMALKL